MPLYPSRLQVFNKAQTDGNAETPAQFIRQILPEIVQRKIRRCDYNKSVNRLTQTLIIEVGRSLDEAELRGVRFQPTSLSGLAMPCPFAEF